MICAIQNIRTNNFILTVCAVGKAMIPELLASLHQIIAAERGYMRLLRNNMNFHIQKQTGSFSNTASYSNI